MNEATVGMFGVEQSSTAGEVGLISRIDMLEELARTLIIEIEALKQWGPMDFSRGIDFEKEVRLYEESLIRQALRLTRGNQKKAASMLGLRHTTLNSKIKRYNLESKSMILSARM